jgi:hypothetical protein
VGVPVDFLDALLVHMRMRMRDAVVRMLMDVLDVLVIASRVGVDVRHRVVLMLVGMRSLVGVCVGHMAPVTG